VLALRRAVKPVRLQENFLVSLLLAQLLCHQYSGTPLTSRYKLVLLNKNWDNAQQYCQSQYQAKLVIVANEVEQLALKAYLDTWQLSEL